MHKLSDNIQGILWTIAYCAVVSIITIATRHIASTLNIYMTSLLVYSLAFALGLSGHLSINRMIPSTKRRRAYFIRSACGVISYMIFAYGLVHMSLSDVAAIMFTSPLFVVIYAVLFLKEKATLIRVVSLILGFIGAMIVIRPMGGSFNIVSIIVMFSAVTYAGIHITIKSLTKTDKHGTISFYTQMGMFVLSIPMACIYWQTPTFEHISMAFLVAFCWHINLYCMSKSHQNSDAVVVMPFQFMRLIFVTIIGYLFFGEDIDLYTIFGSIVILTGAVISANNEVRKYSA